MKQVTEYELSIGEVALITSISAYASSKLYERIEKELPYPDPTPYEVAIDDERSALPGTKIPAKDNPEYKVLCAEVDSQRRLLHQDELILTCVHFGDDKREQALMDDYADEYEVLEDAGIEMFASKWKSVLLLILIRTLEERRDILNIITGRMALTEEEKRDGVRIFRPQTQRNGHPNGNRQQNAPVPEQAQPERDVHA